MVLCSLFSVVKGARALLPAPVAIKQRTRASALLSSSFDPPHVTVTCASGLGFASPPSLKAITRIFTT